MNYPTFLRFSPALGRACRGLLLLLAASSTGCSDSTGPLLTLWEATLSSISPSQITGQAAALTQFGKTDVSIEIRRADAETEYGWRVEEGSCQGSGAIQGGPAVYRPLFTEEGGTAEEEATLATKFRPGDQLAVKVFVTEGGNETIVSCGVLEEV